MRKLTAIIMAIVMTIGFAFVITGCGSSEEATETTAKATEAATESAAETAVEVSAATLPGDYQDSTSQRATMTIMSDDDGELEVSVIWSDSADQMTEWDMDATLQDGKLVYTECEKEVKTLDESGNVVDEQDTEMGAGYFEIDDQGRLLWTGSTEEGCQSCVFERITE